MSLALRPERWDGLAAMGIAAVVGGACWRSPAGRTRAAGSGSNCHGALGLAWFLLASAPGRDLSVVAAQPRQFGSIGSGRAGRVIRCGGPLLVAALMALRLAMLLIAPGAVATIEPIRRSAARSWTSSV